MQRTKDINELFDVIERVKAKNITENRVKLKVLYFKQL